MSNEEQKKFNEEPRPKEPEPKQKEPLKTQNLAINRKLRRKKRGNNNQRRDSAVKKVKSDKGFFECLPLETKKAIDA